MPTSALLERVEQHIDHLDRTLQETETLLRALRGEREERIRQLQERLAAAANPEARGDDAADA